MSSLKSIVSPSILGCDLAALKAECADVLERCHADWLHCDIMDGHFVPNIALGPPVIESLRKSLPSAVLDVHVMVTDPVCWAPVFAKMGAHMYTFHVEAPSSNPSFEALPVEQRHRANVIETAREIRRLGMKVGLAVKPGTAVEEIFPFCDEAGLIDMALVMTVEPGFGGQSFNAAMLSKVRMLRERYPTLDIEVDGGLNDVNTKDAAAAGANVIVAGTAVFGKTGDKRSAVVAAIRGAVDVAISTNFGR